MKNVAAVLGLVLIPTTLLAADGEALYKEHCAKCHGEAGVSKMGMIPNVKETQLSAEQIMETIKKGRSTGRPMSMPPIAGLSDDDVAAIAAYVGKLKGGM
jgi:mono/diheme cytochrome c family protein